MKSASDLHDDVVSAYIRVIEHGSPEVAADIEEIRSLCGSRAALRATYVLALVETEFQDNRLLPDIRARSYLIQEFPGARLLLEHALTCSLLALREARNERRGRNSMGGAREAHPSTFEFPSVQPIVTPYSPAFIPSRPTQ